jgi:5-carboxymethyl-2-hydroxymuconate isomerase
MTLGASIMPHLRLEYSDNLKEELDMQVLFASLHEILVKTAPAELKDCKSCAIKCKELLLGNGDPQNAFIHVDILLAEGRSLATRQTIGQQILKHLEEYFAFSLQTLCLQITVQVREFPKDLYFKASSS